MIGTTLGPYRIDAELGSGGMGKVYRATTTRKAAGLDPDTTVALKIVQPHPSPPALDQPATMDGSCRYDACSLESDSAVA